VTLRFDLVMHKSSQGQFVQHVLTRRAESATVLVLEESGVSKQTDVD
jgi:hypothetical protein